MDAAVNAADLGFRREATQNSSLPSDVASGGFSLNSIAFTFWLAVFVLQILAAADDLAGGRHTGQCSRGGRRD